MLYVFLAEEVDRVKIGFTSKQDFKARLRTTRTHCPCAVKVLAVAPGGQKREREVHERFANSRVRGEWFALTPELLRYLTASKRWRLLADGLVLAMADREPLFAEHMKVWKGTWKERAMRRLMEQYE